MREHVSDLEDYMEEEIYKVLARQYVRNKAIEQQFDQRIRALKG